jgi:predicted amidophosphoribosyltransferase
MRNVYVVAKPVPHHVAIVDDVVTSGATVMALAKALKKAGATRVDIWAVARAPLRDR